MKFFLYEILVYFRYLEYIFFFLGDLFLNSEIELLIFLIYK